MRRADSRADWTAGNSKATRTPMMAMTTSSSTRVNAGRRGGRRAGEGALMEDLQSVGQATIVEPRCASCNVCRKNPRGLAIGRPLRGKRERLLRHFDEAELEAGHGGAGVVEGDAAVAVVQKGVVGV